MYLTYNNFISSLLLANTLSTVLHGCEWLMVSYFTFDTTTIFSWTENEQKCSLQVKWLAMLYSKPCYMKFFSHFCNKTAVSYWLGFPLNSDMYTLWVYISQYCILHHAFTPPASYASVNASVFLHLYLAIKRMKGWADDSRGTHTQNENR